MGNTGVSAMRSSERGESLSRRIAAPARAECQVRSTARRTPPDWTWTQRSRSSISTCSPRCVSTRWW
jgi:hypothetical protein